MVKYATVQCVGDLLMNGLTFPESVSWIIAVILIQFAYRWMNFPTSRVTPKRAKVILIVCALAVIGCILLVAQRGSPYDTVSLIGFSTICCLLYPGVSFSRPYLAKNPAQKEFGHLLILAGCVVIGLSYGLLLIARLFIY
jgi:hypothetical protein